MSYYLAKDKPMVHIRQEGHTNLIDYFPILDYKEEDWLAWFDSSLFHLKEIDPSLYKRF